jgi:predicted enzyme related to lactoylglutathione lyase
MKNSTLRLVGIELYFDELERAKSFYRDTLGLALTEEASGHYAKFGTGTGFVCLERRGSESYPSRDKAVVFFEVANLQSLIESIGRERFVQFGPEKHPGWPTWAMLHDPEGHNVVLLQAGP